MLSYTRGPTLVIVSLTRYPFLSSGETVTKFGNQTDEVIAYT